MKRRNPGSTGLLSPARYRGALLWLLLMGWASFSGATNYYINSVAGNDNYSGTSMKNAWKTVSPLSQLTLQAGDSVLFASGQRFEGIFLIRNMKGAPGRPIYIGSYPNAGKSERPVLDAGNDLYALHIVNTSFVEVEGLELTAVRTYADTTRTNPPRMRCGVLVEVTDEAAYGSITLNNLLVHDVFLMPPGFTRTAAETQSANGTQGYGWGIRFFNETKKGKLTGVRVLNTEIYRVSHTGLKFTATTDGIDSLTVSGCRIHDTGGPGLQLSGVTNGHIHHNAIDHSGSVADSRNWGRGSGMWTWGCRNILIEHNSFEYANGPGDSAGVHIDFNCSDVVVQYNLSANNSGGFCEILGNNFNCAYRYNVSINDGFRIKGENGAFQEGKTFWLSGYRGNKQTKAGPYNSYFYNNTIYVSADIVPKIAVSSSAEGVLIANNIFYFEKDAVVVAGDQKKGEVDTTTAKRVVFQNNLFLRPGSWPAGYYMQDASPLYGDPSFKNKGGKTVADYISGNKDLVVNKGIDIAPLPGDSIGLRIGLKAERDFLGNPIQGQPDLGAIEWKK